MNKNKLYEKIANRSLPLIARQEGLLYHLVKTLDLTNKSIEKSKVQESLIELIPPHMLKLLAGNYEMHEKDFAPALLDQLCKVAIFASIDLENGSFELNVKVIESLIKSGRTDMFLSSK